MSIFKRDLVIIQLFQRILEKKKINLFPSLSNSTTLHLYRFIDLYLFFFFFLARDHVVS